MLELVRAVLSVQHASILQLPRVLLDEQPSLPIAALPFGPTDQRFSRSDGEPEMANLSTDCQNNGEEPKPLFIESRQGSSDWVPATRPHMPIRNRHGEVVSEEEWELKQKDGGKDEHVDGVYCHDEQWEGATLSLAPLREQHFFVAANFAVRRLHSPTLPRCM